MSVDFTKTEIVYGVILDEYGSVDYYETQQAAQAACDRWDSLGVCRVTTEWMI